MDAEDIIYIIISIGGVVAIIITCIIALNCNAVASEKANIYCQSQGYDTYDSFNTKSFSDEPLGIKCNNIKNKYSIEMEQ